MHHKPAPPTMQLTLPFEFPRRADPPQEMEEALVVGRCAPEEAWQALDAPGRDRLHRTWLRVLKEMVADDAQNR
jgi:hypothetical protein